MNMIQKWVAEFEPGDWLHWTAVGVGLVAALVLVTLIVKTLRKAVKGTLAGSSEQKSQRRTAVVFGVALLVNAEGMYLVATEKMNLPGALAWATFAVFELMQVNSMILASAQYKEKKNPGPHAHVVWAVALASGLIVMFNSKNAVEAVVRIVLPLSVAIIWRVNLTSADGVERRKTRFALHPVRLLEHYGLLVPEENEDLERMARDRKVKKLVTMSHRVEHMDPEGFWRNRTAAKLQRQIMTADPSVLTAARDQLLAGRRGIKVLLPDADESKIDSEIERLTSQLHQSTSQSAGQSGSQSGADPASQSGGFDQSVGATSRDLEIQSGEPQATGGLRRVGDDQAVELLRAAAVGGFLPAEQARRIITNAEGGPMVGRDRAKRLLTRAGLTWSREGADSAE